MKTDLSKDLRNFPFVRLVFPFIFGICSGIILEVPNSFLIVLSGALLVVLFLDSLIQTAWKFRFVSGISASFFLFFIGVFAVNIQKPNTLPEINKNLTFTAQIVDIPVYKDSSTRCVLNILHVSNDSLKAAKSNKIIAYFKNDTSVRRLAFRDVLIVNGHPKAVKNSGNPDEFDYKTYLYRKGITGQIFVNAGNYRKLKSDSSFSIIVFASEVREKLAGLYKKYDISGQEYAVLAALTIGDQSEIDDTIKNAFSLSGTTHVLSVSGMHVGLIFIVFNFFLKFLDKFRTRRFAYGSFIKAVILVSFLFFYATLTGLSPSVNRSALMFSLFIIGAALSRSHKIYNTMAVSAFILLLFDPFLITDIGFQLSFLAVFAILFLQKKIENLIYSRYVIVQKVWELTSVALAAQIVTTPLTLYYFHQFPNWFLITNLIIIPISTIIIYAAIALLVLSPVPYVSNIIAEVLKFTLTALNKSVLFVEKLPFPATQSVSYSLYDMLIWYFALGFLLLFAFKRQKFAFFAALIIIFSYAVFVSGRAYSLNKTKTFAVFNVKNASVSTCISGHDAILISDSLFLQSDKKIKYALAGFMQSNSTGIECVKKYTETYSDKHLEILPGYILFGDRKIGIIYDKKQTECESQKKIKVDFLVISKNPYVSVEDIVKLYDFKTVIFDSSNKTHRILRWIEECKSLKISYHSVVHNGAFVDVFK